MPYELSATKLQVYQRCPQAYYFRYERGIKQPSFSNSDALGTALHLALAKIYWEWHYLEAKPGRDWIDFCWSANQKKLDDSQIYEGLAILRFYYSCFIASLPALHKPVAVEGQIKASLQVENLEFSLSGRYDRLDWLDDGLELIDYKSNKVVKPLEPDAVDLQLGLYYLALEQKYGKSMKRLSLIYLRTGETFSFDASPEYKEMAEETITEIALRLREECQWEPASGEQCAKCYYARYCPAVQDEPQPLPADAKPPKPLQLVLDF
ncbi:MAG: PD-(D/E)XK nuclease family protein [Oscillatoria sp. Prado101]|jgi:putative RecB family exonuclease|nr:PD-(D/E)XK nuclease family protein [Oscillatoria sp. Prado101]